MTHWGDTIRAKGGADGTLVLGIDPVLETAPLALAADPATFLERYTRALLDGADGRVAFVKFQSAYFEAFGSAGIASLARCLAMAREHGLAVILDAKRGDIGPTSDAYARAYLEPGWSDLEADCLTVNPFLGPDTMDPFVRRAKAYGKGLFILVKTSNPDSGWLQDERIGRGTVSERVAEAVARWADETVGSSGIAAVGAVMGATYPRQGQRLRDLMPRSPLLAPGLGVQGGDAAAMSALTRPCGPVLISVSRAAAAVEDRTIAVDEYVRLIGERLDGFRRVFAREE